MAARENHEGSRNGSHTRRKTDSLRYNTDNKGATCRILIIDKDVLLFDKTNNWILFYRAKVGKAGYGIGIGSGLFWESIFASP